MSLDGNAKAKQHIVGKINGLGAIRGYSAYEIAVLNGFEGAEAEWLESLKGTQGPQGKSGEKGDKGDRGEKGDKGDTGLQGPKGEKGDSGGVGLAITNGGEIFNDYENNIAIGLYSHASGHHTKACEQSQFVCGQCNNNNIGTLFEVGNGEPERLVRVAENEIDPLRLELGDCYATESYNAPEWLPVSYDVLTSLHRLSSLDDDVLNTFQDPAFYQRVYGTASNAFEVYKDGHAEVGIMGNTDNSVATKQYVDNLVGNLESLLGGI